MSLYVGVNGTPKKVSKLFIGVNNTPKEVKTGYTGGVNSNLNKVYSSFDADAELSVVDPVDALCSGNFTKNDLGKTVYLSNSAANCQEWIIADVNHDGTTGTVDLFSKYTIRRSNYISQFGKGPYYEYYEESYLDDYLESRIYNGFSSNVKNALNLMNVPCEREYASNKNIQRHVVAPSLVEVGVSASADYYSQEGTIYPIFSPAASTNNKSIYYSSSDLDYVANYWTRSKRIDIEEYVAIVTKTGTVATNYWGVNANYGCLEVARIRFAKS